MNDDINQPREFDAVLGGKTPPPITGVVLGGFDGVKHRLQSPNVEVQIMAIAEALNYGKPGLDLVIEVLVRSPAKVQRFIARLLREKGGIEGKQFLLDYDPWLFFTTLVDWNKDDSFSKNINSKIANDLHIVKSAYHLKGLLKVINCKDLAAIVCEIDKADDISNLKMTDFVNVIVEAYQKIPNLKALFIGDVKDSKYWLYGHSPIYLSNVYPIFKAFHNLEVLHLCGYFGIPNQPLLKEEYQKNKTLQNRRPDVSLVKRKQLKINNLKTFIVEGADLEYDRIAQICQFEYPSLEYLELWLGKRNNLAVVEVLSPILSGQACPNLLYLGLIGSNNTNAIFKEIAKSEIIKRLKVLDLRGGDFSYVGVKNLLNFSASNNLHTLNVSENHLSRNMIEKLSQLKCQVISDSQVHHRYYAGWE